MEVKHEYLNNILISLFCNTCNSVSTVLGRGYVNFNVKSMRSPQENIYEEINEKTKTKTHAGTKLAARLRIKREVMYVCEIFIIILIDVVLLMFFRQDSVDYVRCS